MSDSTSSQTPRPPSVGSATSPTPVTRAHRPVSPAPACPVPVPSVRQLRDLAGDGLQLLVPTDQVARDHSGRAQAALTPAGQPFPLTLTGVGATAYATTWAAAIDVVLPGYADLPPGSRRRDARRVHALAVWGQLAAAAARDHPAALSPEQRALLTTPPGERVTGQVVWDTAVPFYLLDLATWPHTDVPAVFAPVGAGPVHLLRAAEEDRYLPSLASTGWLRLGYPDRRPRLHPATAGPR